VNLVDTAGLRRHGGAVEKAGQKSALKIIGQSDLLIWMVDLSRKTWRKALQADLDLFGKRRILLVGNKIDLVDSWATEPRDYHGSAEFVAVSCLTGKGIGRLRDSVVSHINEKMPDLTSGVVVTSARHKQKLDSALHGLRAAREKIIHRVEPELAAYDLREAANAIDEITGKIYTEEILEAIFSRFCVGK
jgi:tRNA modification GTPase